MTALSLLYLVDIITCRLDFVFFQLNAVDRVNMSGFRGNRDYAQVFPVKWINRYYVPGFVLSPVLSLRFCLGFVCVRRCVSATIGSALVVWP